MAQHKERVAIVTGANSGIGEAIARRLAREGATVMLVARNPETLAEVADSIGKDGGRAAWYSTDLSRPESGEEIVTATLEKLGRIDFLVNCASATLSGPFLSFTDEQWVQGFSVKVFGAIRLFKAAWPSLKKTQGAVVNIGGVGARTPRANRALTAPLSAALMALTKIMADVGLREGVRVNMVNPGSVMTPRTRKTLEAKAREEGVSLEDLMSRQAREWSTMRIGQPDDTANLVAYIFSDEGSLLHGSIIDLDGGTTKGL
jgi:NAD(P)-dependent dehydrogenase (short-subunit alcohol dehydrogenase family)